MTVMRDVWSRFLPDGKYVLNRTAWRNKESRTCAVTGLGTSERQPGDPVEILIEVTYKPKGFISFVGNTKYDGWDVLKVDKQADRTLLDGNGNPLPEGQPPVVSRWQVYDDMEFGDMNFGEFVEESEANEIRRTSLEQLFSELKGNIRAGNPQFVAPYRSRPSKKIILTNSASGKGVDGFGTVIENVNHSTPNIKDVIFEKLIELTYEFVEGKASIKSVEDDETTFVELSDVIVDCEPNERGEPSQFHVIAKYAPDGFLDELAKRLIARYAVDVSVIEGQRCGLVLKHDNQKR
jgi:hypothetical protein